MKKILGIIVLLIFAGYLGFTGVSDLVNKKDIKQPEICCAMEILEVEHSINGIIPTGKDHYYLAIDTNEEDFYVIHAPKKWMEKNNIPEVSADVSGTSIKIKGLEKRVGDYKVRDALYGNLKELFNNPMDSASNVVSSEYCIEINYIQTALTKLIGLGSLLVIAAAVLISVKKGVTIGKTGGFILLVCSIVGMVCILVSLR